MPVESPQSADVARFHALARRWREDTCMLSSTTKIIEHPAYQEIIRMGPVAVPLILQDLLARPDHWFYALQEITGDNPLSAENAGNMQKMRDDWLAWGHARGLI